MSKLWTLFLPQVQPETYGAPEIQQIEAIRNAAIEFCETSLAWQSRQIPYPLATVQFGVDPSVPFQNEIGQQVHKILAGNHYGSSSMRLEPQTPEWADDNYPGWLDGSQLGKPAHVVQISPDVFVPVPAASGGPWSIVLRVALKPTRDSTMGPDFLYNDYYEKIAAGAKAKLMLIPNKVWSNPSMAGTYEAIFDDAAQSAKLRAAKGFGRGAVRTKGNFL